MATMLSEVYTAFRKAGVPEEDAKAAAEALSAETVATKKDVARIEKTLAVHGWILNSMFAMLAALLVKAFWS